jgi:hypothetical protein
VAKKTLRFLLMFSPVTFSIDFNNRGMVDNPVDGSHRHQGVREDLIPVTKRLIRCDNQTATFIPMGDKFKQDLGL